MFIIKTSNHEEVDSDKRLIIWGLQPTNKAADLSSVLSSLQGCIDSGGCLFVKAPVFSS